jgi:protein-tyrosine kinase
VDHKFRLNNCVEIVERGIMNASLEEAFDTDEGVPDAEHHIGVILINSGRLKKDDAMRVMRLQRKKRIRFGDAGIELGVLNQGDIQYALAQQFRYPYAQRGESKISADVICVHEPNSSECEAFRALRTQLMLRWFQSDTECKALAIISPDREVGCSWVAANLAVTFAQLGKRTVLLDADLRQSSQHRLFGFDLGPGLSDVLSRRARLADVLRRDRVLPDLAVLTAGEAPPNPQEMISRVEFQQVLDALRTGADVIIIDTSTGHACADGQIVALKAHGAMLVARQDISRSALVRRYSAVLKDVDVKLIGSVMLDR